MDFTPQGAFNYIKGKLDDFYAKGRRLRAQEQAANVLVVQLQGAGYDPTPAYETLAGIEDDLRGWNRISNMLSPILSYFGYNTGLGLDPVTLIAIGGTLIAVAVLLYSWYNSQRLDQHDIAIRTLAANIPLSDADQAVIDNATSPPGFLSSIFPNLGDLGSTLLIGGAVIVGLFFLSRR